MLDATRETESKPAPILLRVRDWVAASAGDALLPRWLFLRALGLIYFSAFYSLAFEIHGLIGPGGILPAGEYLTDLAKDTPGPSRFWGTPTLLWLGSGDGALTLLVVVGLVASALLTLNLWPRVTNAMCLAMFLSFISAAQDFSGYQSDGMLMEAGFLSLFFAPAGMRPGLGSPPSRLSLWLLRWEWFRIYFESGLVKLLSGDAQWKHLTAMDHYYENGPLPSWVGWYVQQELPHLFHAATAGATLVLELLVVWLAVLPRPFRRACFFMVTPFQVGIILTANYAFLNYLVLAPGLLLLDDALLARWIPWGPASEPAPTSTWSRALSALPLIWQLCATVVEVPGFPARALPRAALEPAITLESLRVANQYGLFAVMTEKRREIELQASVDGQRWIPCRFKYKPQDVVEAPGIFAPRQPRFEWNLWFASLEGWSQTPWVLRVEQLLLRAQPQCGICSGAASRPPSRAS